MFKFLKRNKKEPEKIVEEKIDDTAGPFDTDTQIKWMKQEGWISDNFDINRKNILIMDDRHEIISSMIDDLRSLSESIIFNLDYRGGR